MGINLLFGGVGLKSETFDHVLSIIEVLIAAIYLYIAVAAFYGVKGIARFFKVLTLIISATAIVLGYRFVLLLITLSST